MKLFFIIYGLSLSIFAKEYSFEGVARLSNCSGSLVIFEGQDLNAKGQILTNAHCLHLNPNGDILNPFEVVLDKFYSQWIEIYDKKLNSHSIMSNKILFASFNYTDVAILELDKTYKEIFEETTITPFLISHDIAKTEQNIQIISGFWMKVLKCEIVNIVNQLQEGGYFFKSAIKYSKSCTTLPGMSGSPLLLGPKRIIVGIHNTANENGEKCTIGNPCEIVHENKIEYKKNSFYGQQIYWLYDCLDENFKFSKCSK